MEKELKRSSLEPINMERFFQMRVSFLFTDTNQCVAFLEVSPSPLDPVKVPHATTLARHCGILVDLTEKMLSKDVEGYLLPFEVEELDLEDGRIEYLYLLLKAQALSKGTD
jgi:hypothetical protein